MPKTWRFLLEKATLSGIYIVQRIGITTHKNAKIVIASDAEPPPPPPVWCLCQNTFCTYVLLYPNTVSVLKQTTETSKIPVFG